jgi:hypothetical protein
VTCRDFQNGAQRISYDYRTHAGAVLLDEGCRCDVTQVVELFAAVDPQVRFVKVIAGRRTCVNYEKLAGHWIAHR